MLAGFTSGDYSKEQISFLKEQWNNLLLLLLFACALFLIYIYILRKRRNGDSVLEQSRSIRCYEQKGDEETKSDKIKEDSKWVRFRGSYNVSPDLQQDQYAEHLLPSRINEAHGTWLDDDSDQFESDQEIVYPGTQLQDHYYLPSSSKGSIWPPVQESKLDEGEIVEDDPLESEDRPVHLDELKRSDERNASEQTVDSPVEWAECVTSDKLLPKVLHGNLVEDKPFSILHDLSVMWKTVMSPEQRSEPLGKPDDMLVQESLEDGNERNVPVEGLMSAGRAKDESLPHKESDLMGTGEGIHPEDYPRENYYDLGEWSDLTMPDKKPVCEDKTDQLSVDLGPIRSATTVNDAGFSNIMDVFDVKLLTYPDDTGAYLSEDTLEQPTDPPVTPRPSPESSFDNADTEGTTSVGAEDRSEEIVYIRHSVQSEEQTKHATANEDHIRTREDSNRSQDSTFDESIQSQAPRDDKPKISTATPISLESAVSRKETFFSPKRDSAVRRISSRWEVPAAVPSRQTRLASNAAVTQSDTAQRLPTLPERQSSLQDPPKERVEVLASARSLPTDMAAVVSEPSDEWPERDVYFRTLNSARSSISASSISQLFSSSQETIKQSSESLLSEEGPGGKDSNGSLKLHRKIKQLYTGCIEDRFDNLEDLSAAVQEAGLSHSRVIIGIDYSISNLETGRKCFGGKSLHNLDNRISNPYQEVIRILCNTLNQFDEDNLICAFGFGDSWSTDRYVFPLSPAGLFCRGFDGVLQAYNMKTPTIKLGGPTNFAPLIRESIQIVKTSKTVIDEGDTVSAIVEASKYPISIILVGVGDGPWDTMQEFDDALPARRFDNFQFVNYQKVCQLSSMVPRGVTTSTDYMFALMALMEIPDQYQIIKNLGYIDT